MKIVMSGASGFVGSALRAKFAGHEIVALGVNDFAKSDKEFEKLLDNADVVINLAGAPIIARWSDEYKKVLYSSRIETTKKIIRAMIYMQKKPKLLISTSAIGIYTSENEHTIHNAEISNDFLGRLCQDWEYEANKAKELGVRVVIFRFGVVLGRGGGALQKMLPPFRLGLGGVIGSGEQAFSWIHLDDLVNAYEFAISNEDMKGPYNLVAPEPTTNRGLTKALGRALHRPTFLPVPEFVLKLMYSEGAKVLTDGQHVLPKTLLDAGFKFTFCNIDEAIKSLV
jgi:hypothetical protein